MSFDGVFLARFAKTNTDETPREREVLIFSCLLRDVATNRDRAIAPFRQLQRQRQQDAPLVHRRGASAKGAFIRGKSEV